MEENINNTNQNTVPTVPVKKVSKIGEIINKVKLKIGPSVTKIDAKFAGLMPNQKLRKIVYIAFGSLFGFMFLIIFLGLLFSPMRNSTDTGTLFKKPNIVAESPKPEIQLSERQKEILKLQTEINNLKFPESVLTPPLIESNLSI